jgi:hypothetical protein
MANDQHAGSRLAGFFVASKLEVPSLVHGPILIRFRSPVENNLPLAGATIGVGCERAI